MKLFLKRDMRFNHSCGKGTESKPAYHHLRRRGQLMAVLAEALRAPQTQKSVVRPRPPRPLLGLTETVSSTEEKVTPECWMHALRGSVKCP